MSTKRILILGPESTGKTTLCEDLSTYFEEPFVPEFAREYLLKLDRSYVFDDLSTIAKGQIALEDSLFKKAKKFLFCDTDLRVIHIWSDFKYGKTDPWIVKGIARRSYDFIFLCGIDTEWEADPLREHPEPKIREQLFDRYLELTQISGFPFLVLNGSRQERQETAIQALKQQFE